MDPDIEFEFEGVKYTVSSKAFTLNRIELPDGRLIAADSWTMDEPPVPIGLHAINVRVATTLHFDNTVLAQVINPVKGAVPMYILVSNGDGACVLKVVNLPHPGDKIAIDKDMILWQDGFDSHYFAGHIYEIGKQLSVVAMPKFGDLPWFVLEKVEI